MADNIQATPRNYFGGLLTDAYKWMQSPERTQQMQGFAGLLGTTGVPQTIERMAYGEPLTNISRANVPLLKPETADALMTVGGFAPEIKAAAKMLPKSVPVGMSIKPVDDLAGLLTPARPIFDVSKRDASEIFGAGAERVMYKDPTSGGAMEVLAKPDGTASVLSLEVPEKFRGKGIGESLQAKAMQDFPSMMGQVSSKAAAKTAYRLGRRPPSMPDATLDDVYKLMDENSSVNLVSPEMQKRFVTEGGLLGQQAKSASSDLSYRGSHTAPSPEFGAPLHDLTGGGQMYPADVYSPKAAQYYGTGYPKADKEAFALANKVRGNPDAEVTMYRAVPKDASIANINAGDWVTLSKDYAKNHGESVLGNNYKILSQKVKAKDLWTNADSIHEFGYQPQAQSSTGLLD